MESVTGYEIFVDGSSLGTIAGTSVDVTGLTACTSYNFGVRALDAAGNSSGTATALGSTTGCSGGGGSPFTEGYFFETGLDGWADGGSDCFRYNGNFSYEGNYSMRLRDNSGVGSSMTSPSYDLDGLGTVEVEFYFYPRSMENGEDFWLRYNDGTGWQTVASYASGTDFSNNTFYTATVTLNASSFNLTDGAQFRFQCDASANADLVYIDQITVTGSSASGSFEGPMLTIEEVATPKVLNSEDYVDAEVALFPNPATDLISVRVGEEIRNITIYSIHGQKVFNQDYIGVEQTSLDVRNLVNGAYFISIRTEEETMTERLIIQK